MMVKNINVTFNDDEFEKLKKRKGKLSWHDFIMKLLEEVEGGEGSE